MKIKFCGITRLEDAELCVEHGAWALGMIFVPSSPRKAKQTEAARIVATFRRKVELVGVFVNAPLDHIARTVDNVGLTMVQLHGDEGPSFASEVARRTGAKVIKAARVKTRADVVAMEPFHTDFHLFDGQGGTTFEWELTRHRRTQTPLMVAGGLTHENVGAAIRAIEPFAVDVASGIESSPGIKDPAKVAAFAEAVRAAEAPPVPAPALPPEPAPFVPKPRTAEVPQ
ncbi:MAG TPA: phosphoribosylanthranilate isomerase [Solirubrobacteraceae bacterium]|nr:phosphoribosylanthranilate isomerase [Solirubrobacteraceae bacterium]